MVRGIVSVVVLVFAFVAVSDGQVPDAVKQSANNICQVTFADYNGVSLGSGVYIKTPKNHYVVSCYHLIDDVETRQCNIRFPYSNESIRGSVAGYDSNYDQLLIKLDSKPKLAGAPVRMFPDKGGVRPNEMVYFGGYAGGSRLVFHGGKLTNRNGRPVGGQRYDWRTVSAGVWSGMSGGPVFDSEGYFIGDLWGGFSTETTFVCCQRNCEFLRALFPRLKNLQDLNQANRGQDNCGPNGCNPNRISGGGLRAPFPGVGSGDGSTIEPKPDPTIKPDDVVVNQDLKTLRSEIDTLKQQLAELKNIPPPKSPNMKPVEDRLTALEKRKPQIVDLQPLNDRISSVEQTQKQFSSDLVDVKKSQDNLIAASKGLLDEIRVLKRDTDPAILASRLPGIDVRHNGKHLGNVKLGEEMRFNFIESKLAGKK